MSDQDIMSEFVELNKAYIARGDRIQELESLLRDVILSDDDINIDCGEIGIPESLRNKIVEALTEDKE